MAINYQERQRLKRWWQGVAWRENLQYTSHCYDDPEEPMFIITCPGEDPVRYDAVYRNRYEAEQYIVRMLTEYPWLTFKLTTVSRVETFASKEENDE